MVGDCLLAVVIALVVGSGLLAALALIIRCWLLVEESYRLVIR